MIPVSQKQEVPEQPLAFSKFPGGLNTSVPSSMISKEELSSCVDFKYNKRGDLEIRSPITKFTTTETSAAIATIGYAEIDGTDRTLICDTNYNIYYLGSTSGTEPTLIGTAEGESEFLSYNNVALVMDGSYLKYMDDVTELKIAYDVSENFFDNSTGTNSGSVSISTSGVGCIFTTPIWGAGFTIPPIELSVTVRSTSGTGTIEASFFNVSSSAEIAATNYALDIPLVFDSIDITYSSTDITAEFEPNTQYRCLLKGANVDIAYTTVSTGGTFVTGGVTLDATKNPLFEIKPGLPPKAKYGTISDQRPWFWGDPDNLGTAHYGKLSYDEFGSLPSVDDNANSFEIGGLQDLFGDLYVYGTQGQPYIATLIGDTEAEWQLKRNLKRAWTLPKTIKITDNEIFTGSKDAVKALEGVQGYGDVRIYEVSDRVSNIITEYWSASAFSGYYPRDKQYWLFLPGYSKVLICHTEQSNKPWTEYSLPITPTYFKQAGDNYLIGCADKYLYSVDTDEYKDLATTQIEPEFSSAYIELPVDVNLRRIQFIAASLTGANFDLDIYKNGNQSDSVYTYNHLLSMSDSLTVDDLTMDIEDMLLAIDSQDVVPYIRINIPCWSFQIKISAVKTSGKPVYFSGLIMIYQQARRK